MSRILVTRHPVEAGTPAGDTLAGGGLEATGRASETTITAAQMDAIRESMEQTWPLRLPAVDSAAIRHALAGDPSQLDTPTIALSYKRTTVAEVNYYAGDEPTPIGNAAWNDIIRAGYTGEAPNQQTRFFDEMIGSEKYAGIAHILQPRESASDAENFQQRVNRHARAVSLGHMTVGEFRSALNGSPDTQAEAIPNTVQTDTAPAKNLQAARIPGISGSLPPAPTYDGLQILPTPRPKTLSQASLEWQPANRLQPARIRNPIIGRLVRRLAAGLDAITFRAAFGRGRHARSGQ